MFIIVQKTPIQFALLSTLFFKVLCLQTSKHRICKNSGDETRTHNICIVVAGGTKPISSIIYYALKVKNVFTVSMCS